jgi:hypothetical protein
MFAFHFQSLVASRRRNSRFAIAAFLTPPHDRLNSGRTGFYGT